MSQETIEQRDGTVPAETGAAGSRGRPGSSGTDGKDRPRTTTRPRTEAEIVAGIERGIEEEDRAEIARMFRDQRLEPEYLEPDGGFHEVKVKRGKPFSYLPLDKRAFKVMRMIGMTWGEISKMTRLNLSANAAKLRYLKSAKHN